MNVLFKIIQNQYINRTANKSTMDQQVQFSDSLKNKSCNYATIVIDPAKGISIDPG